MNCVLFSSILRNRWRNAPRNKSELLKRVESGELRFDPRGSYVEKDEGSDALEDSSARHMGSEHIEIAALSIQQRHGGVTQLFIVSLLATACIVVRR